MRPTLRYIIVCAGADGDISAFISPSTGVEIDAMR